MKRMVKAVEYRVLKKKCHIWIYHLSHSCGFWPLMRSLKDCLLLKSEVVAPRVVKIVKRSGARRAALVIKISYLSGPDNRIIYNAHTSSISDAGAAACERLSGGICARVTRAFLKLSGSSAITLFCKQWKRKIIVSIHNFPF